MLTKIDNNRRGRLSGESLIVVPVIIPESHDKDKNSINLTPRYENVIITQNNNNYDKKINDI